MNVIRYLIVEFFREPYLRGFVCASHPAALGSNPKHTSYAFFNLYCTCMEKRTKINKKRPGFIREISALCLRIKAFVRIVTKNAFSKNPNVPNLLATISIILINFASTNLNHFQSKVCYFITIDEFVFTFLEGFTLKHYYIFMPLANHDSEHSIQL